MLMNKPAIVRRAGGLEHAQHRERIVLVGVGAGAVRRLKLLPTVSPVSRATVAPITAP